MAFPATAQDLDDVDDGDRVRITTGKVHAEFFDGRKLEVARRVSHLPTALPTIRRQKGHLRPGILAWV